MSWNIEGAHVTGLYMNVFPFAGIVTESRVKYGGQVQHTVKLDSPIEVFGATRNTILIDRDAESFEIA